MALSLSFTCALPNGLHARPASLVEKICSAFSSDIAWINRRSGSSGNAKSVLALIGTDSLYGDACELIFNGADEADALVRLSSFVDHELPHCDPPLPAALKDSFELPSIPRNLANLNPSAIRARPVSAGVAEGRLVIVGSLDLARLEGIAVGDGELQKLNAGLQALLAAFRSKRYRAVGVEAEVLDAQLSIAGDMELAERLRAHVAHGMSCGQAIAAAATYYRDRIQCSASALMREREMDVRDVCFRLAEEIYGPERVVGSTRQEGDVVCLADNLTPAQFMELDKTHLKGLLLGHGSSTSHTVILTRSFNIPTLVGVDFGNLSSFENGNVIVDADTGLVVLDANEAVRRYYDQEKQVKGEFARAVSRFRDSPGISLDGRAFEIAANISLPDEAAPAFTAGAQSIGLFRTEMMFLDRDSPPGEEEQYGFYRQAVEAANGRYIIIRTIDVGGDKPLPYLNIPAESNPFLGFRAVRIYAQFIELFRTQLRAILRASAHGPLKLMIPMISSLEEVLWVKEVLADVRRELREASQPFDEKMPLGIMLEVPSLAYIIDQCCDELDFFSVGSNDLTQYLLAVDRENALVSRNFNSLNPAFLRALDHMVREVHRYGKWIGLCGELGADVSALPLLVGVGLDEISVRASSILETKAQLSKLDSRECRSLVDRALECRTPFEVENLLGRFRGVQNDMSLVSADCVMLDVDFRSKEEVIKAMTDRLFLVGRCRFPSKLADDVWAREDVFSTGLGFGFAIPHTKSEYVEQSSISVARLTRPIVWGDEQVQIVIMLALDKCAADDEHLRIFSRLARRIMSDEFRAALRDSGSSAEVETLLRNELQLQAGR